MSDNTVLETARHAILAREAEFHDALASELDAARLPPREPDELEVALLEIMGDLRGRHVLDLGCGQGDLSLMLLQRGAEVTGLDVSPGMVDIARRRAQAYAPRRQARFVVGDAQATGLPAHSFDLVVGKWIVHHLDVADTAAEMARVLRPDGSALFIENQGRNPLLRFARERVAGRFGIPRYGTPDEHPLLEEDFALIERHFPGCRRLYPDFFFFRLFDRQVLRQRWRAINVGIRRADLWVARRVPRACRYSYHVILQLRAPSPDR